MERPIILHATRNTHWELKTITGNWAVVYFARSPGSEANSDYAEHGIAYVHPDGTVDNRHDTPMPEEAVFKALALMRSESLTDALYQLRKGA